MTDETGNGTGQAGNGQDWYEIEVEGRFDPGWFDCLEGWTLTPLIGGNTLLSGWVIDQPALHGIFARIRDMNVKIVSLGRNSAPRMTTALPPAALAATEVRALSSRVTGQEYRISVALPFSYRHEPERTYPAVYVLDGDLFFGLVTGIARLMQMGGTFPEVLVIGIGYPLDDLYGAGLTPFVLRRDRDFTPVVDPEFEAETRAWLGLGRVESGGAGRFLTFVDEELIPAIESGYRTAPGDRTLVGHSLGGMAAAYALFRRPRQFRRYVIGSPALGYGDRALFAYEEEYAAGHDDLPARVFLGIGGDEDAANRRNWLDALVSVADFHCFAAVLEGRGYEGLALARQVFEGHAHLTVVAPLFQAGLASVFS